MLREKLGGRLQERNVQISCFISSSLYFFLAFKVSLRLFYMFDTILYFQTKNAPNFILVTFVFVIFTIYNCMTTNRMNTSKIVPPCMRNSYYFELNQQTIFSSLEVYGYEFPSSFITLSAFLAQLFYCQQLFSANLPSLYVF